MTRRAQKRPNRSPSGQDNQGASHCRALVLVDGTGIRNKIKKEYEKARRDLANSKQQLDQFHHTDVPQFTQWLNTNFGALLTELRELAQKLAVDEDLIFRVENEVFFAGTTYARAYKRIIEGRPDGGSQSPPPADDEARKGSRGPGGEPQDFDEGEDGEDPLEAFFNEIFGESEPRERAGKKQQDANTSHQKAAARREPPARVKELYRALVRQLHPDTQREMTAQKAEWWHQAQEAYQAGDADQLEVILTLCEMGDGGTTAQTSASLLQRITAQLKSSLREIKRQITQRRKDPAWGFSDRADHGTLSKQMRRDLQGDLEQLRERWEEIQEIIAGWKAAAERIKPRKSRRGSDRTMEFPF